jgi:hypothetical protein
MGKQNPNYLNCHFHVCHLFLFPTLEKKIIYCHEKKSLTDYALPYW